MPTKVCETALEQLSQLPEYVHIELFRTYRVGQNIESGHGWGRNEFGDKTYSKDNWQVKLIWYVKHTPELSCNTVWHDGELEDSDDIIHYRAYLIVTDRETLEEASQSTLDEYHMVMKGLDNYVS